MIRNRILGHALTSRPAFSSRGFSPKEGDRQKHCDWHESSDKHQSAAKETEECRGDCLRPCIRQYFAEKPSSPENGKPSHSQHIGGHEEWRSEQKGEGAAPGKIRFADQDA